MGSTRSISHAYLFISFIRVVYSVHRCIDGHSRWIMYLHASDNNHSATVTSLFV